MRRLLVTTSLAAGMHLAIASAQAPPAAPPTQPPAAPTTQAPRPRAAAQPAARPALTVEVTDTQGVTIPDVLVRLTGTMSREGRTDQSGQLRFATMRAGNYRLRFEREGFVPLERDVTVANRTLSVDAMLTAAPPPPKVEAPPPPPPPPAPIVRPAGEQKTTNVPTFVEQNFISARDGKKESLVGCTGEATSTLIQLRDPLVEHTHAEGSEMLYVVAGEATHRVGDRDETLTAGSFSAVPRGTAHSLTRRGRNPVIVISTLAGQPCDTAAPTTTARNP